VNRRSYYTHEDSDGLSNGDEDEIEQDYRLLMAYANDNFLDALEEEEFLEEITKLKICLEEKNMIIDTLTHQLTEREKHNEILECEIVGPRKELDILKLDILKNHLNHKICQPTPEAILMQQRPVNNMLIISKGLKLLIR